MTTKHILLGAGDAYLRALDEAGFTVGAKPDTRIVLATTERTTAEELREHAAAHPERVRIVELTRPDALDDAWDDPDSLTQDQHQFRFPGRSLYVSGGAQGAQSRREAAMRAITSGSLTRSIDDAVRVTFGQPNPTEHLSVDFTVGATTHRNSGSALIPILPSMAQAVVNDGFAGQADVSVTVLVATRSINSDSSARRTSKIGRACALVELAMVEDGVPAGPGLPQPTIGHIYELGAPVKGGMLADEKEARGALGLALDTLQEGAIADAFASATPKTLEVRVALKGPRKEAARFSALGVAEVVLEPEAAQEFLVERMFARLPQIPDSMNGNAPGNARAEKQSTNT